MLQKPVNRFLIPGFLLNSVPKAGTHLLLRAIQLFPGVRPTGILIKDEIRKLAADSSWADPNSTAMSAARDRTVPLACVSGALKMVKAGHYGYGHLPYSDALASLISDMGLKLVLIMRDPRDVVVSHAHHIAQIERHRLFDHFQSLSEEERIMACIRGVGERLRNIDLRFRAFLPWISQPLSYTTYFDRLVGVAGGGMREDQIEELENIARHLGLKCSPAEIDRVACQLFGNSATFRRGLIGSWRCAFTEAHSRAFKEVAGPLLIELGYERDLAW